MTGFHAFRKGIQLCHTHFSLLWLQTGWRMVQFSLSLGFALLAGYTLLEPVGFSDFEFESAESGVGIFKVLVRILQRNDTLIFKIILLTLCFAATIWLLLASFFQAGILGLLTREQDSRGIKARDALGSGIVFALGFCRKGVRLFSSFFLINLAVLFFSFTGSISLLVILRYSLRLSYFLGEASSEFWTILVCSVGIMALLGILGVALMHNVKARILQALHIRLDQDGYIDWDLWCIDGSSVRAARAAAGADKKASNATKTSQKTTRWAAREADSQASSTWLLTARECR